MNSFSIHQVEHIHDLYDDFIFNHTSRCYAFFCDLKSTNGYYTRLLCYWKYHTITCTISNDDFSMTRLVSIMESLSTDICCKIISNTSNQKLYGVKVKYVQMLFTGII